MTQLYVVQTSSTTFELQTDNGCVAVAGFAVATMGKAGIYFLRQGFGLLRETAEELFRADPKVKAALNAGGQHA